MSCGWVMARRYIICSSNEGRIWIQFNSCLFIFSFLLWTENCMTPNILVKMRQGMGEHWISTTNIRGGSMFLTPVLNLFLKFFWIDEWMLVLALVMVIVLVCWRCVWSLIKFQGVLYHSFCFSLVLIFISLPTKFTKVITDIGWFKNKITNQPIVKWKCLDQDSPNKFPYWRCL